jgi:RimJ/RimL family protein N-acetyltransferase
MDQILLRPWQRNDVQQLAKIANNKNVWNNVRDRLPSPYTVMDALQWVEHCSKEIPHQNLAIVYNNIVAGTIGCTLQKDVARKNVELGYFIDEQFWGKGIATEAVRLMIDYIQQHFDVMRIFAEVFEHNKASMKVLEKNGFYLESIRKKSVIKNNIIMNDYVWVKLL